MNIGPFALATTERLNLSGAPHDRWEISYDGERFGWHHIAASARPSEVAAAFAEDIATWCDGLRPQAITAQAEPADYLKLIDVATDQVLGTMPWAAEVEGLRNAIPDDRHPTWLVTSTSPAMAMPMSAAEFARLRPAMVALHTERLERAENEARQTRAAAPAREWICQLLPSTVLTQTAAEWRAPSSWEIRHIVGEGSLTGISGAQAAELVGVTPQNFRKYTAADGAATRQKMGFAMWHALLHALDIQHMRKWGDA